MIRLHAAYFAALFIGIPLAVILGITAILVTSKSNIANG